MHIPQRIHTIIETSKYIYAVLTSINFITLHINGIYTIIGTIELRPKKDSILKLNNLHNSITTILPATASK